MALAGKAKEARAFEPSKAQPVQKEEKEEKKGLLKRFLRFLKKS